MIKASGNILNNLNDTLGIPFQVAVLYPVVDDASDVVGFVVSSTKEWEESKK